jgi:flagellar basal body rod protein FlgB
MMSENEQMADITKNLTKPAGNPLTGYFRQPKIFLTLPSKGKFYPEGSIDLSESGDYPVFAMTAKDELMFKTPDALLSGQSTVEVIQSCIPSIKDAWKMPSIDVDAALVAIRVATYGENMDVTGTCPFCEAETDYEFPLNNWLSKAQQLNYVDELQLGDLTIHIRPYSYREMTKSSLKAFEQQRLMAVVNDEEELSDSEKIEKFQEHFVKITELTIDIIAGTISQIDSPNGSTTNKNHIKEFVDNAPKDIFDKLQKHIGDIKNSVEIDDLNVNCGECKAEYKLPITMDQSNFFALES